MAVEIEVREYTLSSGTGAQSLGGNGFTPKAAFFIYTRNASQNTDSTSGNGVVMSFGCCDGTREWACASGTNDGITTSDVGRRSTVAGCILNIDNGFNQTVEGLASFTSFDSDGVNINKDTAFINPTSPLIKVIYFGGTDVSVYTNIEDPPNTIDTNQGITAIGFEPDVVIAASIGNHSDSDGNGENDDHAISIGWVVNPDRQASNNQFCIDCGGNDGVGTENCSMRIMNNRFCGNMQSQADDPTYEIASFDTNGFTYTTRDLAPATLDRFFYLALLLGGSDANVFSVNQDTPTATGNQSQTGTSFTPIFLLGITVGDNRAFTTTISTTDAENQSIGIALTDGTRKFSVTHHADDGATTMNADVRVRNTHIWSTDDEAGTLLVEATFTSFNTDGWTFNFGTVDSVANKACQLAIGDVSVAGFAHSQAIVAG